MQAFEGEPYGIEWTTDARISHLEMTNDITRPGALPLVDMEIDGQTVSLVLDTGGDRLYLDRDIYASLGLATLANRRITLRERTPDALAQVMATFGDTPPVEAPFFMTGTHLMVAKGSLNGHEGINYFMDSGLAMSMPMIVVDETVELLGLQTNAIDGTEYFWTPIESHGLNGLVKGATQAMGNVFVEDDFFWRSGFMMDALISHQYLWPLGSWTIDFDRRMYYFPGG